VNVMMWFACPVHIPIPTDVRGTDAETERRNSTPMSFVRRCVYKVAQKVSHYHIIKNAT